MSFFDPFNKSSRLKTFPVFYIALNIFLFTACNDNSGNIGRTVIYGDFPDFKGSKISLSEIEVNRPVPIDTLQIEQDGSFKFKFDRDSAGFYLLKIDNRNYITLALDKEKKIQVRGTGKNLKLDYTVKGSEGSELLQQFEWVIEKNRARVDSLTRVYNQNIREPQFQSLKSELEVEYEKIFQEQRAYVTRFVEEHCQSLASLMVINRRFGQRKVLTEEEDFRYFFSLDSCLSARYPGNQHVKAHHAKVEKIREQQAQIARINEFLAEGRPAPEMKMNDIAGNVVSLRSLKDKKVIIYFWSTSCASCRDFNADLLRFYHDHRKDGIEILAVSFDTYANIWKDYIQKYKLDWINVSDLMGPKSSARSLFNVPQELPYFILLDKGSIIKYKGSDPDILRKFAGSS